MEEWLSFAISDGQLLSNLLEKHFVELWIMPLHKFWRGNNMIGP